MTDVPKLRVALVGIRGIPAQYGGSETAAEEIYPRLAARDHDVVVYCRRHKVDPDQKWYKGVRTVVLPSVNTKSLDTITATFLALIDVVARNRADIIHIHGIGNAMLFPFFRVCGKRVVTAVDGMDWTRAKWNRAERAYLRLALYMAVHWPMKCTSIHLRPSVFARSSTGASSLTLLTAPRFAARRAHWHSKDTG